MKEILKCLVESAHAAESGCEGDLSHGHSGLVDELFGEEHSAGLGYCDGRGAEVLKE